MAWKVLGGGGGGGYPNDRSQELVFPALNHPFLLLLLLFLLRLLLEKFPPPRNVDVALLSPPRIARRHFSSVSWSSSLTHTHTHTHMHSYTHTHTQTYTLSLTHTHTHTLCTPELGKGPIFVSIPVLCPHHRTNTRPTMRAWGIKHVHKHKPIWTVRNHKQAMRVVQPSRWTDEAVPKLLL
ncbi:unnamed protein product [Lota lota]